MTLAKICVLIIETLVIGLLAARLSGTEAPLIRIFGLAILCFIIGYVAVISIEKIGSELVSKAAVPPSEPPTSPLRQGAANRLGPHPPRQRERTKPADRDRDPDQIAAQKRILGVAGEP